MYVHIYMTLYSGQYKVKREYKVRSLLLCPWARHLTLNCIQRVREGLAWQRPPSVCLCLNVWVYGIRGLCKGIGCCNKPKKKCILQTSPLWEQVYLHIVFCLIFILSVSIKVHVWWTLQTSPIFLSATTCRISSCKRLLYLLATLHSCAQDEGPSRPKVRYDDPCLPLLDKMKCLKIAAQDTHPDVDFQTFPRSDAECQGKLTTDRDKPLVKNLLPHLRPLLTWAACCSPGRRTTAARRRTRSAGWT